MSAPKQPALSILIAAIRCREPLLKKLTEKLNQQIAALNDPSDVEIVTFLDDEKVPIGDKRQKLVSDAKGQYCCFVDDDDDVADSYVSDLVSAIKANLEIDCITFKGVVTWDGLRPRIFGYSVAYPRDKNTRDLLQRRPNHICAIRSDIAKAVPFVHTTSGEDIFWAKAISSRLTTETHIDKQLYFYRFSRRGTKTQSFAAMIKARRMERGIE